MHRHAVGTIPEHSGFALIGNADGGNITRMQATLAQCIAADGLGRPPNIHGVMLNPAIGGKMLLKLDLSAGDTVTGAIKNDGARASSALIDR